MVRIFLRTAFLSWTFTTPSLFRQYTPILFPPPVRKRMPSKSSTPSIRTQDPCTARPYIQWKFPFKRESETLRTWIFSFFASVWMVTACHTFSRPSKFLPTSSAFSSQSFTIMFRIKKRGTWPTNASVFPLLKFSFSNIYRQIPPSSQFFVLLPKALIFRSRPSSPLASSTYIGRCISSWT